VVTTVVEWNSEASMVASTMRDVEPRNRSQRCRNLGRRLHPCHRSASRRISGSSRRRPADCAQRRGGEPFAVREAFRCVVADTIDLCKTPG
jgi:hypothetical protein